jgi:hypothetical protein
MQFITLEGLATKQSENLSINLLPWSYCELYSWLYSLPPQLNDNGEFNIDEELQNVPPEIMEEGHRIIKTCHDTRMIDYSLYIYFVFYIVT